MATMNLKPWAVLVLSSSIALADATGSLYLSINRPYSLDTASMVDSGGDILFTGSSVVFRDQAIGYTFGTGSAEGVNYDNLTEAQIAAQYARAPFTNAPITGSYSDPRFPLANEVFAVRTNGNHFTKIRISVVNPDSIFIIFQTYGGPGGGPNITSLRNNYSPWGSGNTPNSGIAQGAIFIIQGTNLATQTGDPNALASSAPPGLPLTLNGASVTVTVGSVTVRPAFYYALPTQLGLVLPSNTPTGGGSVVVTSNGVVSAAFPILVVPSALGLATMRGSGSGQGIATDNKTGALVGYMNSAARGQTIVLWGSGLGATTPANDLVFTTSPKSIIGLSQLYIGGIASPIAYQGESGYPGVNQVVLTIPQNVPLGCSVSVTGVSGAIASNTVMIPIAAQAGTECSDPVLGMTGSLIQRIEARGTYTSAVATISQETADGQTKRGAAVRLTGQSTSGFTPWVAGMTLGSCSVDPQPNLSQSALAGGNADISGPMGTQALPLLSIRFGMATGQYESELASTFLSPSGGSFIFRLAAGTSTVFPNAGAFQAEVKLGSELVWTNKEAIQSIDRSKDLRITWSGGDPDSFVTISGGTGGASQGPVRWLACYASVAPGEFTIPSYVLGSLPVGTIFLTLTNRTGYRTFTADGLDFGAAVGYRSVRTGAIELR